MTDPDTLDLFAGPGGWSVACSALGLHELGVELDAAACSTRRAAGFETLSADVSTLDPASWRAVPGFIASPPCQAFSMAGKKSGHDYLGELAEAIRRRDWSARPSTDPKVWLVLEVGRYLEAIRPEWVALEQVPAVLPLWHEYADLLRGLGYSVWVGKVNAADYGVPQVRIRAVLLASRVRVVPGPPPVTHAKEPVASLFGMPERWVTMAEALGWTGAVGFPRLDDRGDSPDGYRERDWRSVDEPSFAVTEKARSWIVNTGRAWGQRPGGGCQKIDPHTRPAPAFTSKSGGQWHLNAAEWTWERPATTLQGDPRIFHPGGHIAHDGRDNTKMKGRSEDAIRVTVADALALQSFPPDFPVQGSKTKQFEQIGNAVPPLLAWHLLRWLTGRD